MSASNRFDCVFRLDAGTPIGMGHLSRCLVLMQALKKRGLRKFAILTRTPAVVRKAVSRSVSVISVKGNEISFWKKKISKTPPQITIIDSYQIKETSLRALSRFLPTIAFFDDCKHLKNYPVDALINGNIHAQKINYRVPQKTKLFLGPRYLCLSNTIKPQTKKKGASLRFFVVLGGVPQTGHLMKIGRFLSPFAKRLRVDMAGGLTHNSSLFRDNSHIRIASFKRARQLMAQADIALSTASVTSYELARLGVPTLLTVTADNQLPGAKAMHKKKTAYYLGRIEKVSQKQLETILQKWMKMPQVRNRYAKRAQKLVDGKGADRLAQELIRLGRKNLK